LYCGKFCSNRHNITSWKMEKTNGKQKNEHY
jgi:hypothetical protein